jgi:hypothetical protein
MLIQHRLVAQRRPAFGNEYQPAFAPREMLSAFPLRTVERRLPVARCGGATPHAAQLAALPSPYALLSSFPLTGLGSVAT